MTHWSLQISNSPSLLPDQQTLSRREDPTVGNACRGRNLLQQASQKESPSSRPQANSCRFCKPSHLASAAPTSFCKVAVCTFVTALPQSLASGVNQATNVVGPLAQHQSQKQCSAKLTPHLGARVIRSGGLQKKPDPWWSRGVPLGPSLKEVPWSQMWCAAILR